MAKPIIKREICLENIIFQNSSSMGNKLGEVVTGRSLSPSKSLLQALLTSGRSKPHLQTTSLSQDAGWEEPRRAEEQARWPPDASAQGPGHCCPLS